MKPRKIKRGAVTRDGCIFIGAWVPNEMASAVDIAVLQTDLDRSKFMRRALQEKVARHTAGKGEVK
jgi:hypothetical protein